MKTNSILKGPKKKFSKLEENIMNRKKDNKSQNRMKRFCSKFEYAMNIHYFIGFNRQKIYIKKHKYLNIYFSIKICCFLFRIIISQFLF